MVVALWNEAEHQRNTYRQRRVPLKRCEKPLDGVRGWGRAHLPLQDAHDWLFVRLLHGLHALPTGHVPQLDGAQPVPAQQELPEGEQHLHGPAVPALGSRDGHLVVRKSTIN